MWSTNGFETPEKNPAIHSHYLAGDKYLCGAESSGRCSARCAGAGRHSDRSIFRPEEGNESCTLAGSGRDDGKAEIRADIPPYRFRANAVEGFVCLRLGGGDRDGAG